VAMGQGSRLWCEDSDGEEIELGGYGNGAYSVRSIIRTKELYLGQKVSDILRSPLVKVL
jgi:hypothetical protein